MDDKGQGGLDSRTLPAARQPLVGRDAELESLLTLLRRDDVRCVTVTGTGGSGKSVLVEEAARQMGAGGECSVETVSVVGAEAFGGELDALQAALRGTIGQVVPAPPAPPPRRRRLVVVDGADSSGSVRSALSAALDADPDLTVLITSVAPLDLEGEHRVPIGPLDLPSAGVADPARAQESSAVMLFCRHARSVDPAFALTSESTPSVVALCRALDGLPLALELAAARCATLPVDIVLDLYQVAGPALLTRLSADNSDRHRSLHETIECSWRDVSPDARGALTRLSVFAGPFTWAAAIAVAGTTPSNAEGGEGNLALADSLHELVAAGLLRRTRAGEAGPSPRFVIPGPIRHFAAEHLDERDRLPLRRRHAEHFRAVAHQASEREWSFGNGPPHDLLLERDDLLAALHHVATHDTVALALMFAIDLEPLWLGLGGEIGADRIGELLGPGSDTHCQRDGLDGAIVSRALVTMVMLRLWSRHPLAVPDAVEALAEAETLATDVGAFDLIRRVLAVHTEVLIIEGLCGEAVALARRGIDSARKAGDTFAEMLFEQLAAMAENNAGHTASALEHGIVARNLARAAADDYHLFLASHVLGGIAGADDDPRAVPPPSDALLAMARRLGSERLEAMVLIRAAMRAAARGDAATAAGHMVDGLELGRRTGMWYLEEVNLLILVSTALAAGRLEAAAELHGALHDVLPGIKQRLPVRVGLAYDQTVSAIETALGADAFAQRAAVGSLWTWPQAVLQGEQLAVSIAATVEPRDVGPAAGPREQGPPLDGPGHRPELSGRERDVLVLIATGASNKDIGLRLGLQTKTVMHYTSALYRKLGVGGRAEAVSRAWRYGLLESDPDIQPRAESG